MTEFGHTASAMWGGFEVLAEAVARAIAEILQRLRLVAEVIRQMPDRMPGIIARARRGWIERAGCFDHAVIQLCCRRDLRLDPNDQTVHFRGNCCGVLPPRVFSLVMCLSQRWGKVVSYVDIGAELGVAVSPQGGAVPDAVYDSAKIARRQFRNWGIPAVIKAEYKLGYRIFGSDEPQTPSKQPNI